MSSSIRFILLGSIVTVAAAFVYSAAGSHHGSEGASHHSGHSGHVNQPTISQSQATEGGQGAFAALQEIVAILQSDPDTDWATVDIDGLREHLVDMNQLTLNANVETVVDADKVIFKVTGEGATLRAIRAMVPAHAAELSTSTAWDARTVDIDNGIQLSITAESKQALQKVVALGFFGVMATGAHHQMHHLAMAKGQGH